MCYIVTRALELAIKHKTHVDTVLAFRHRHLEEIGWKEILPKFQQYGEKVSHRVAPAIHINILTESLVIFLDQNTKQSSSCMCS